MSSKAMIASARAVNAAAVTPALKLLPRQLDTPAARVLLLAIGLQESLLVARRQVVGTPPRPTGPAAGLWQFERSGVAGVLKHEASRYWAHAVCAAIGVEPQMHAVWVTLPHSDVLAAAFARLLLFTDPKRLPPPADAAAAWRYYKRFWRPGKPHPARWPASHAAAVAALRLARAARHA